ncbi:hypothetical protein [Actinacidiphila yeochonensis]|uniref:hypothetical protein n=1 Tax=Actinacidiphila yeochonensis TaxID=89050 RepID=UPI00056296C0|nr:hypothetical protein [Actinacidiphila yeochonensis]
MSRSTLPAAAAVVVGVGLLLTACGGGGSGDSDKIKATGTTASASQSTSGPSPTPTATGVPRPTITLPSGAQNVFEDQHTGDAKKDAVLADNQSWVDSMDEAILKGSSDTSHISFYSTGTAFESSVGYVKGYLGKKDTWVGTTRFFQRKVTFLKTGEASVVYCGDESKAFIKHSDGTIDKSPATSNSYVLYNTRLAQNGQGVWQTEYVVSQRGAKECQP